jgi:hypothetical protein
MIHYKIFFIVVSLLLGCCLLYMIYLILTGQDNQIEDTW